MVLIDLRVTHNLIDDEFMKKNGLKTKYFEGFHVTNANGKLKLVENIIEKFGVSIQGYEAMKDFYVYPLHGIPRLILKF